MSKILYFLLLTTSLFAESKYNAKLQNGGFDSNLNGWKVKNNYFLDSKCYKTQNLDGESKQPKSLRLESTDAKKWTGATQLIKVQPGAVYRVSGWAKIKNAGNSLFLFEFFKNIKGKSIRTKKPIYMFVHVKGTKDWFKRERYVQAPEDAQFAKVTLRVRDGSGKRSYAWFDQIEVEKSFNPPPKVSSTKWLKATEELYGKSRQAPAMSDKVVYYDPKHEFFWIKEPERIKTYLASNGFKVVDAKQLKAWMQKKIKSGADGSVCVLTAGTAPKEIVETFKTPDVTFKHYIYAGGRIVWPGNIPLYNVTSSTSNAERWPIKQKTVRSAILGFESAKFNQHVKVKITDEGKKWGLRARHEKAQRLTKHKGVTLSLSKADKQSESGTFFKNYNIKFPYSGFIRYRADQTDATNNKQLQDIYRLAIFRGKAVKAPKNFPVAIVKKMTFAMSVTNFYQGTDVPLILSCAAGMDSPVTVSLTDGKQIVFKRNFTLKSEMKILLPTSKLKSGNYELSAVAGKETCNVKVKLLPVKSDKLAIALYSAKGSTLYKQHLVASTIASNLGDCGYIANKAVDVPMNNVAFAYGLKLLPRSYAHNYLIRRKISGDREMRLKDGSIPKYHYGKRSSSPCFYNKENRQFTAKYLANDLELMKKYPAYKKRMLCYDDGAMFGEPGKNMIACYCKTCKAGFKQKTGHDAPIAPAPTVLKKGGVIPDSNIWGQWMRFRSKDVFGDTFGYLNNNVIKKVAPEVKFCHILGDPNMTFDPQWALNPADEFANTSMIVYYYYPHASRPSYMHLPFAAKAVVGNRNKDLWPTGQSTDYRGYVNSPHDMAIMIRNQFYCMIAGGAKGTIWYDYNSLPGTKSWKEFGELAKFANKFGPLIQKWDKSQGKIAILMSYTNASFKWANSDFSKYSNNLDAFYLECLKKNIQVDFVGDKEVQQGILKQYRALLMLDEDYMLKSVATKIDEYISNNGKVFISKNSKVKLPGAKYGIQMQVLKKLVQPIPLTVTGSDKVVWSEFTVGQGKYYLLVSTDLKKSIKCKIIFHSLSKKSTIANLDTSKVSGNNVTLEIAPGGAALMAVIPETILTLKISNPESLSRGQTVQGEVMIIGSNDQIIDAGIPVKIEIVVQNKVIFSDYNLANRGLFKFAYPVGSNTQYDELIVKITELISGKTQKVLVKVK